jgi:hypothetical protein
MKTRVIDFFTPALRTKNGTPFRKITPRLAVREWFLTLNFLQDCTQRNMRFDIFSEN